MSNKVDPSKPLPDNIKNVPEPISQEAAKIQARRLRRPAFMHDFPRMWGEPRVNPNFTLLPPDRLEKILRQATEETRNEIERDIKVLEADLMPFFVRRDYEAARYQTRYRRYQIYYILLAVLATIIGAMQALATGKSTETMAIFGFIETMVALSATFIAALSSFDPPLQKWIRNRRIAEFLRQEYFRFLLRIDPYDHFTDRGERELYMARRAAEINQGRNPEVEANKESTPNG